MCGMKQPLYIVGGVAGLFAVGCGVLGYLYYSLSEAHQAHIARAETTETELRTELATTTAQLDAATTRIAELTGTLDETEEDLRDEKNRNEEFEDQINEIAGTVGDLDKLSKTDEELLQKYSKVYFLNEHYVPSDLEEIDDEYKYDESRRHQLHEKAISFFEDMLEDAKEDGIELWVTSAYRSFEYQSQLKGAYTVTYGSGANTFSADQGFSEHQLGTTVDFTTRGLGGGLNGFGNTAAFEWLVANAHKYGFVLSYPEDNAYYVYEPWHWRFVGTELAEDLRDANAHFYDWDQRKIDQYLLHIFD